MILGRWCLVRWGRGNRNLGKSTEAGGMPLRCDASEGCGETPRWRSGVRPRGDDPNAKGRKAQGRRKILRLYKSDWMSRAYGYEIEAGGN